MSRFWAGDRFWVGYRWFFTAFSLVVCVASILWHYAFSAALNGALFGWWLREGEVQAERQLSRGRRGP